MQKLITLSLSLILTNCVLEDVSENISEEEKKVQAVSIATKKIAQQVAYDTAKKTADTVSSALINQSILKLQEQLSDLTQQQKTEVKNIAIQTAKYVAESTARQIASSQTDQAIENMKEEFSDLYQQQKREAKNIAIQTAKQVAEGTAKQIASSQTDQAIENMKEEFSDLSQQQKREAKNIAIKTAEQVAEGTAKQIASSQTDQAIENMKEEFSDLTQQQKTEVKNIAIQTAEQVAEGTAKQIAFSMTNQALDNLEKQFSTLSHEQMQVIKSNIIELSTAIAIKTANETAKNIASTVIDQAIENMQKKFTDLSEEQIQNIKLSSHEVASSTAQEITNNIIEETVRQAIGPITDQAIQDMEQKYSDLLKEGLRTIISAAIETATVSSYDSKNSPVDKQEIIDVAVEQAGKIAFKNKSQSSEYLEGPFFKLPFEQCNWTNTRHTNEVVKDHSFFHLSDPLQNILKNWSEFKNKKNSKEANQEFAYLSSSYDDFMLSFFQESVKNSLLSDKDVPLECFFASAIKGSNLYKPGKNFYYCEKDSNQIKNISVIDNKDQPRNILPRRACLNKDYIYLTARAFNKTAECFGFTDLEKEDIFKLFNHESSFLHNIKSNTGAKCYGQLTTIAIKEVNKQIYFSNTKKPKTYSYIFNEVIKKCPGLQKAVLNPKIYENTKTSISEFNQIISQSPASCKITQNPYSCLFYSFYNIRINMDAIQKILKGPTSHSKTNKIPKEFKDKFLLPVPLNSMLGVTNSKDMIFWDDSEVWNTFKNYSKKEDLKNIRKLALFKNEAEVKELFNFWTYNGGISIAKDYMISFIKQLKKSIAKSCPKDSQTKICQYRFSILRGEGVSTEDIKKDFQAYIQKNYKLQESKSRRKEVINFANNVEKSLNYLYNRNGLFKTHLKNLVPNLTDQEISNFQNHLKEVCPSL